MLLATSSRAARRCVTARMMPVDTVVIATVGKIFANTVTYPLETFRLFEMIPPERRMGDDRLRVTMPNLYRGYGQYLPYSVVNYGITYGVMFALQQRCMSLAAASLLTCMLVSLYKVPCMYFLKNKMINQKGRITCSKVFWKAYAVTMLEDVPEMYLKFWMNDLWSGLGGIERALMVGVASTALLTPMDVLKIKVFCNVSAGPHVSGLWIALLRTLIAVVNTTVFFWVYNMRGL